MYLGVGVNYMCKDWNCRWIGSTTQPFGHILKIMCPMCDKELEVVDTYGNQEG